MANTKPITKEELKKDFTSQPQATTREDVEAQDTRTRLWQSFQYPYEQQMEDSDKQYDKAVSQTNNQALARGMQRSSYNNQTVANLLNQKVEARNNLGKSLISDYQRALTQQEEAEAQRDFQRSEREAQQAWQTTENALNRNQEQAQFDIQQAFTEKQFAYNYAMTMIERGQMPSDDLLAQAGLNADDVAKIVGQGANGGAGSITWRQSEDAAAKAAGFKDRNDPGWIAYKNGGRTPSTIKPTDSSTLSGLDFGGLSNTPPANDTTSSNNSSDIVGIRTVKDYTPSGPVSVSLSDELAKRIRDRNRG